MPGYDQVKNYEAARCGYGAQAIIAFNKRGEKEPPAGMECIRWYTLLLYGFRIEGRRDIKCNFSDASISSLSFVTAEESAM